MMMVRDRQTRRGDEMSSNFTKNNNTAMCTSYLSLCMNINMIQFQRKKRETENEREETRAEDGAED